MSYFDTDSICYHEELPEALVRLQDAYWKPIIEWTEKTYDVKINTTNNIFAISQPNETKEKLRTIIEQMDALELAAFEKAVMSSKSFLIGFALVKNGVSVENAARAAHVEMTHQMERWGEVEDSKYKIHQFIYTDHFLFYLIGHDVEREYIRQTLGSAAVALMHKHQ